MFILRYHRQLNIYCAIFLVVAATGCSLDDSSAVTTTPTQTAATLAESAATSTPTLRPTEPPATSTATPAPPTAMPTFSATPVTTQRDHIPRFSQRDSLPSPTPDPVHSLSPGILCTVNTAALNLREGPDTAYKAITMLDNGATVSAQRCYPGGEWLLVETTTHAIGWAKADFLTCQGDPSTLPLTDFAAIQAQASQPAPPSSPIATPTVATHADNHTELPLVTLAQWRAEYYDNASLLGEPALVRQEPDLDFNWLLDSPAPTIPNDNFSARWTRLFDFSEGGDYRFFANADDGVRVYVDGWLVIDAWHTDQPVTHIGEFADIQPGLHSVTVEYFESGGYANIKVWAEQTTFTSDKWLGEYYNNPDLRDPATFIREDEVIDFDWDNGSPGNGLDGNHFSVRWTRTSYFGQGDYRFYAKIEDRERVKLYLDDWLIIDKYRDSDGTIEGAFDNVGAGNHTVTVEYQEDTGPAEIEVWWERD